MKKFFVSEKYIQHQCYVTRKALKRRLRRQQKSLRQKHSFQGKNRGEIKRIKDFAQYVFHIRAPLDFRFLEQTEEVVRFFNQLEDARLKRRKTFVVLKDVQVIDYGAVSILLSIVSMFKLQRIGFNGDFPRNGEAKKLIIESGFFDCIGDNKPKDTIEYIAGRENQIVTHANRKVTPELGIPLMEAASLTVWGEKRINGGLHSVLMELMQNTNNHASSGVLGEKHWWLSVNHDAKAKKVTFAFVDHGTGILTSLGKKPPGSAWEGLAEKVRVTLGVTSNEEFIKALLEGKIHSTITGKAYRGKGLPNVKRMLDYDRISNLHVVTNNVFGNVAKSQYKLLGVNFQGTFFYWELTENNFSKPWNI